MNASEKNLLTIAIPTYGRPQYAYRCIEALLEARESALRGPIDSVQILVLVNGPFLGYENVERRFRGHVALTWTHDTKPGLSRARNYALARSHSCYVAYIDDDAIVPMSWVDEALTAIAENGCAAIIGGPYRARFEDSIPKWLPDGFGSWNLTSEAGQVRWVSGGNMIVKRALAQAAGGFSDHFGMNGSMRAWGEEADLCRRLLEAGHKIYFEPRLVLEHTVKPNLLRPYGFLNEEFRRGFDEATSGWAGSPKLRKPLYAIVRTVGRLAVQVVKVRTVSTAKLMHELSKLSNALGQCHGLLLGRVRKRMKSSVTFL